MDKDEEGGETHATELLPHPPHGGNEGEEKEEERDESRAFEEEDAVYAARKEASKRKKLVRSLKGLGLVVAAQLCFSLMALLVKVANQSVKMSSFQLVFVRSALEWFFVVAGISILGCLPPTISFRGYTILGGESGEVSVGQSAQSQHEEEERGEELATQDSPNATSEEDSEWWVWFQKTLVALFGPREIWNLLLLRGILGFGAVSW